MLNQVKCYDERPSICEERSKKNTRHKKSNKTKSQESLTERENAKNREKTFTNNVERGAKDSRQAANIPDEKPALSIHESGNGNHVDKRKTSKEKKIGVNKSADNAQERRVAVNGATEESGPGVELTCAVRIPVQEEPAPKHCGTGPAQEALAENQAKKTKSRKKKKGQCLGKIENIASQS